MYIYAGMLTSMIKFYDVDWRLGIRNIRKRHEKLEETMNSTLKFEKGVNLTQESFIFEKQLPLQMWEV